MNKRIVAAATLGLLASATAAAAQSVYEPGRPPPARPVHQPTYRVHDGVIAGLDIPSAGSGTFQVYVTLTVSAPGNHRYAMYWTYLGQGAQFIPRIGSICQIDFHYEAAFGRETDYGRPRMVVDTLDCDSGQAGQDRP
jgi:hypothetical protein